MVTVGVFDPHLNSSCTVGRIWLFRGRVRSCRPFHGYWADLKNIKMSISQEILHAKKYLCCLYVVTVIKRSYFSGNILIIFEHQDNYQLCQSAVLLLSLSLTHSTALEDLVYVKDYPYLKSHSPAWCNLPASLSHVQLAATTLCLWPCSHNTF